MPDQPEAAMSDAEYIRIKERAARRLLKIPHVKMVALGGREKNGQPTGEIVIKVFVARKRPVTDLPADEVIPAAFEGVPTDVVEMGTAQLLAAVPGSTNAPTTTMDPSHADPLLGGLHIAIEDGSGGTLGCILRDKNDGSIFGLTNHHVIAVEGKSSLSRLVLQPSAPPATTFDPVGIVSAGGDDRYRDAVAVRLEPEAKWLPKIRDIGFIRGTHTVTVAEAASHTYQVRKRGARTQLTGGVVVGVNGDTHETGVNRKNDMVIRPNPDPTNPTANVWFAFSGDSGSVVVNDDNEVVALLYSADLTPNLDNKPMFSFATPIAAVLDRFKRSDQIDVEVAVASPFDTATDANQTQIVGPVPGAPVLPIVESVRRGEHAHLRPLRGGSQILAAPMAGAANAATLGCLLEDPANPGDAYALTAFHNIDANGTIPPTTDTDIGQPDNDHSISGCCSNIIGKFFRGGPNQQSPIAAMAKLEDDQKWVAEIVRIGRLLPPRVLSALDLNSQVRKHGAHSRLTGGTMVAIGGVAGTLPADLPADTILVRPNPNPLHPTQDVCFSRFTDRGAVIVDEFGSVLGLLYDEREIHEQGRLVVHGIVTPIQAVLAALKVASGVAVAVATANSSDQVRTTSSMQATPREAVVSVRNRMSPFLEPATAHAVPNLQTTLQDDLSGSPGGRWVLDTWLAHRDEIRRLINENGKVAARWHLGRGPALLQALIRSMYSESASIPGSIDGQPIAACLDRIANAFIKHGSEALRRDLARLRTTLPPIAGLSYSDLITAVAEAFA